MAKVGIEIPIKDMWPERWGVEQVLDIFKCKDTTLTEASINGYFIAMSTKHGFSVIDYHCIVKPDHITGVCITAYGSIVLHATHKYKNVLVNIVSNKNFNSKVTGTFTAQWFGSLHFKQKFFPRNIEAK